MMTPIQAALPMMMLAFFVGCVHSRQMSRDEIVHAAERFAVAQGVNLAAVDAFDVKRGDKQSTWNVYYRPTGPVEPEYRGWFIVVVDERSGEAHLVRGE